MEKAAELGNPLDGDAVVVYVVRHGSTALNEEDRLRGWLDVELSGEGWKQAKHIGKAFDGIDLAKVYCSDLKRAVDTADEVANSSKAPIEESPTFRPINFGKLQGMPVKDIEPEMKAIQERWKTDPGARVDGGESFSEFQSRNISGLEAVVAASVPGTSVAVVAHLRNCILFLAYALNGGKPLEGESVGLLDKVTQDVAGISVLKFKKSTREWQVHKQNYTDHLDDEGLTSGASLFSYAGYPKHPDTVIIATNEWYPQGLTEAQIWSYYDSVKEKLAPQLYGAPVTVVTVTPRGAIIRRNDPKTKEPIHIDSVEDFNRLNNGRNVEFHRAMGRTTGIIWADLDPKENCPWPKVIDAATIVRDSLMGFNGIENVRVAFSGNRGFHVRGFLTESMDIDEARRMVIQRLEAEAVPRIEGAVTGQTDDPDAIRFDVSTLHSAGSLRVPWSLNAKTGLMALDYEITGKGLAELEKGDFSIANSEKYLKSAPKPGMTVRAALDPVKAEAALKKLTDVATAGSFRVYLVGGSVRDKLMGLQPKDLDVVVFHPQHGLKAPAMLADSAMRQIGAKGGELTNQGTVMTRVDGIPIDLAAPRLETYEEGSRKPEVQAAGIKEDAMRRDFTINALYEDLQNPSPDVRERIVDPTGRGMADLEAKVLRSPNPQGTFLEDPLRMLRAIRFHAKTGFELDPETAEEMRKSLPEFKKSLGTKKLSWERVQEELAKTLMTAQPGKAFRMMTDYGLTGEIVPEWNRMVGLPHDTPFHLEPVDEHTMMVLDEVGKLADGDVALRLAAILHDIGKPATKGVGDQLGSFLGHEEVGAEMAEAILRRLRFPNDVIERVKFIVGHHMRPHGYRKEWSDKAVRRFVREMGGELEGVLRIAEADVRGRRTEHPAEEGMAGLEELRQRIQEVQTPGQDIAEMKPLLDGNEIMAMFPDRKQGKWIGDLQDHLIDLQLGDPAMTKEQAAEAAKAFMALQGPSAEKTAALHLVSYIVHMPGHANSKGEPAPWVIKQHETGKILSSHKSKEEAEKHLREIRYFKHKGSAFSFDPNSTENEGRYRIRNPKDFDQNTFRRWKTWAGVTAPDGVSFIVGDTDSGKAIQTIRFDKAAWDEESASHFWNSIKDKPGFERTWEWPRESSLVAGTVGFCHDRWRDGFYKGCRREDFLSRYSRVFGGVEVMSTRYSVPTTRVLYRWADSVPKNFVFAPHSPASVRPSNSPEENRAIMAGFLARLSVLGEKLGPIVVTVPDGEPYSREIMTAFFDALPPHRYAFLIKSDKWWFDNAVAGEVARRGNCLMSWMGEQPSGDWSFVRIYASHANRLRDIMEGSTKPGYYFVEDKSSDPSAYLSKLLFELGLLPAPGGVVSPRKMGPRDIRTDTGPGNAGPHAPILGPDSPAFEEPDPNTPTGEERSRSKKQRQMTEPTSMPDCLDDGDGKSDPLTGTVEGDTRTNL